MYLPDDPTPKETLCSTVDNVANCAHSYMFPKLSRIVTSLVMSQLYIESREIDAWSDMLNLAIFNNLKVENTSWNELTNSEIVGYSLYFQNKSREILQKWLYLKPSSTILFSPFMTYIFFASRQRSYLYKTMFLKSWSNLKNYLASSACMTMWMGDA